MQINTTKTGERLKLTKREKDTLTDAKLLCARIARFGMGPMSELADKADDSLIELVVALNLHELESSAPEPAAK